MLSPGEFGLIGMITVFISIAQVFVDSGLSQSLIRKQNCTADDYSTIFWTNLIIGILSYIIIWLFSPFIASWYGKPELIALTRVTSLTIIIGSFTLIQQTMLTKEVDFKTITKSSTIGTFIAGITSLGFAYFGFGVWSLVIRTIINQLVRSVILWNQHKWVPRLNFSKQILKEHLSFSSNILLISVIAAIYKSFYNFIIGIKYSAVILGYFTNADQYSTMFSSTISNITSKVSYPVMSEMQNDDIKLQLSINKLIINVMYISFIVMFGLAAIAKPLFVLLLGAKWLPSVIMFQVLCVSYSITPMHGINQNLMKIKGRSDLYMKTEIFKYLFLTPLLVAGAIMGINILIIGIAVFYWCGFVINAMYSRRLLDYSIKKQIFDFLPVMVMAAVSAGLTWGIGIVFSLKDIYLLTIQVIVYPCLIVFFSVTLKMHAFFELKQILSDKLTISNFIKTIKGSGD